MGRVYSADPEFRALYLTAIRELTGNSGGRPQSDARWLTMHNDAVVLDQPTQPQFTAACAAQTELYATDGLVREVHIARGEQFVTTEAGVEVTYGLSVRGASRAQSGARTAATLNAQIAEAATLATEQNPIWIVLPDGTVTLDAVIALASHVYLRAQHPGATRLTRSDAPAGGLADDPTNAVMSAAATVSATTTTLTSDAAEGDTSLTVADTTGFVADDWILIETNDANGTDALGESGPGYGIGYPSLPLYHLAQIDTVTDPTHLALKQPVQGYFSALDNATFDPSIVTKVTPIEDVRIEGLYFDCAGGSIANGILARAVVGIEVRDCRFRGFSRAGVNLDRGTREWLVEGYTREGETNSDVLYESTRNGAVRGFRCRSGVAKSHANGVPRFPVFGRLRNCEIDLSDLQIHSAQGGIGIWGDWHLRLRGFAVWDCDPTDRQARATAVEIVAGSDKLGVGLDMGTTSTLNGYTAYARDVKISDGEVWDVVCPGASCSVYLHDAIQAEVRSLSVINHGRSPDAAGARMMKGVVISDVGGHSLIDGLSIAGCDGPQLTLENAGLTGGGVVRNLRLSGVPGTTPSNAGEGIYFNTDSNGRNFLVLDGVFFQNFDTEWTLGASFVNDLMRMRHYVGNASWAPIDEMIVVRNQLGAFFEHRSLGEISDGPGVGDLIVGVVASTGVGTPKNVVMYSPTGGGSDAPIWLAGICGRGKSNTIRTSRNTAIVTGDKLVAGAGGNAVVDNAAAADLVVGVAMQHATMSAGLTVPTPVM